MSIVAITEEEFSKYVTKSPITPTKEYAWYKSTTLNVIGVLIQDGIDKDWGYVILTKDENENYSAEDVKASIQDPSTAETALYQQMFVRELIDESEELDEELYNDVELDLPSIEVMTIDDHIKAYFRKHPEKLYDLSPRKFEELVASIIKDMGFEVELTQATRDGGRDIIAYIRTEIASYLTHIECKRYAPDNKVGVDIIRSVTGVHHMRNANKSIIVTTGFFTKDAREEAKLVKHSIELKDYDDLKIMLSKY